MKSMFQMFTKNKSMTYNIKIHVIVTWMYKHIKKENCFSQRSIY